MLLCRNNFPQKFYRIFGLKKGFRQAPRVEPVSSSATLLKPLRNRCFPGNSQDLLQTRIFQNTSKKLTLTLMMAQYCITKLRSAT